MRIIGIDLAVKAEHRAVVVDARGRFVTPVLKVTTRTEDLDRLLARAREGAPRCKLCAVMEPTGMAWFPVAVYLIRQGVLVYLVNSQAVIDLRRVYHRHAKSDRIDTRVLAQLPLRNPETLHSLKLGGALALACQRGAPSWIGGRARSRPAKTGSRRRCALPGPGSRRSLGIFTPSKHAGLPPTGLIPTPCSAPASVNSSRPGKKVA